MNSGEVVIDISDIAKLNETNDRNRYVEVSFVWQITVKRLHEKQHIRKGGGEWSE